MPLSRGSQATGEIKDRMHLSVHRHRLRRSPTFEDLVVMRPLMIVSGTDYLSPFDDYGTQGKGHGRLVRTTDKQVPISGHGAIEMPAAHPGSGLYTLRKIELGLVRAHDKWEFQVESFGLKKL